MSESYAHQQNQSSNYSFNCTTWSCGQSASAGIGKVQLGASWRGCFGNGHQTMTLPIANLNTNRERMGLGLSPC